VHYGPRTAAILNQIKSNQMCIASLLNRRYLQVSGSVRVRRGVVGRLGLGLWLGLVLVLRLGRGLALGLQLGIGIGFRRSLTIASALMILSLSLL